MRGLVALFSALLAVHAMTARADAAVYSEAAVKAAFIHRFASYVHWPAPPEADAPFIIAVAGADGVGEQLEALLPTIAIQNRPAQLRRVASVDQLAGVQILYVGPRNLARYREVVAEASRRSILIVTDEENGLENGGVINFVHVGRNVRLEVSLAAADRSRLRIDSALLAVAVRVEGPPQTQMTCGGSPYEPGWIARCSNRLARLSIATPAHEV